MAGRGVHRRLTEPWQDNSQPVEPARELSRMVETLDGEDSPRSANGQAPDAASAGRPPGLSALALGVLIGCAFVVGGSAATFAIWWRYGLLLQQGTPYQAAGILLTADPVHSHEDYCKRLLTLGDIGGGPQAGVDNSLEPEVPSRARELIKEQICSPLAGNSDIAASGFELVPPYWRMIDIQPSFDLPVNTVSFYCDRASTISVAVGVYSAEGLLLTSSGKTTSVKCGDQRWLDMRVPEILLKGGEVYYIAHLHSKGTWKTARGVGNQFCRTVGKHFYAQYQGDEMPFEQPVSVAWGNGASDEAALVVKYCHKVGDAQAEADKAATRAIAKAKEEQAAAQSQLHQVQGERAQLQKQVAEAVGAVKAAEEEREHLRGVVAELGKGGPRQQQLDEQVQQRSEEEARWWEGNQAEVAPVQPAAKGRRFAFVMMSYTAPGAQEQIWGILAVAAAIRKLSQYPLVVLTNSTHFSDGTSVAEGFKRLGVKRLPAQRVDMPNKKLEAGMLTARWKYAYWKLQIWKLTDFDKLIWLDSDTILYRSVDWLFERDWMWAQRDDWFCKLEQTGVCSGVMLLEPNEQDYYGLLKYAESLDELTDGDQQLIMMYFANVRKRPINLLSDVEASFGQCLGRATSPYVNVDGSIVTGSWSTPAVVHKSGGWGNTNNNDYANACFQPNVSLQFYVVGNATFNACQYHPLGAYWRDLFCEAAAREIGVKTPEVLSFCNDGCWYRGVDRRPEEVSASSDEVLCVPNSTIDLTDYYSHIVGRPILEPPPPPLPPPPTSTAAPVYGAPPAYRRLRI